MGEVLEMEGTDKSAYADLDLIRLAIVNGPQFDPKKVQGFQARESSLLGVIGSAVRLHYANRNAPGTPGLFRLVFSRRARQQQFQRQMEGQKTDLRTRQAQRGKVRADTLRASCRLELSRLSETFQKQRAECNS